MKIKNKIRIARLRYILKTTILYLGLITCSMFFLANIGINQIEKIKDHSLFLTNPAVVLEQSSLEATIAKGAGENDTLASPQGIEEKIKSTFPEEPEIALAVAKGESGLHTDAIGYNCRYNGLSQSCKPEDLENAWSVDCGLYQINRLGKTCPTELFNPDTNLKEARAKYEHRGWTPWVAWNNGQYKNHLE